MAHTSTSSDISYVSYTTGCMSVYYVYCCTTRYLFGEHHVCVWSAKQRVLIICPTKITRRKSSGINRAGFVPQISRFNLPCLPERHTENLGILCGKVQTHQTTTKPHHITHLIPPSLGLCAPRFLRLPVLRPWPSSTPRA